MVNVLGLSGLRNAYRSVLSAVGSSEIRGASRWLDAVLALGARRPTNSAVRPAAAATRRNSAYFVFISRVLLSRRRPGSLGRGCRPSSRLIRRVGRTGSDRRELRSDETRGGGAEVRGGARRADARPVHLRERAEDRG